VRDEDHEQIGSANQFIEVPDISKGLTLSSILMTQMLPEAPKPAAAPAPASTPAPASAAAPAAPAVTASAQTQPNAANTSDGQMVPGDPKATPAVRIFKPGESIEYGYQILNPESDDIEVMSRIFRDGIQVNKDNPTPFKPTAQADAKHLVAAGAFRLGAQAPAGDYMLQVIVTEKKGDKRRVASQSMDFEVEK